jgi:SAM-dependent methyltransferase
MQGHLLKKARRLIRRGMERTGLIGPYYRAVERRLAREPTETVDDGRPMPPAYFRVATSGTAQQAWFSERGRADAAKFADLARTHGVDTRHPATVLDFGCGCGRIARWLAADIVAAGGRFHGADINPQLVGWCEANLPGHYFRNGLQPPLDLPDRSIDLVYSHSVLTHLSEPTAIAWLAEAHRILRPGALALLSFSDEAYTEAWGPPEALSRLRMQPYVVWNDALEGSNYLSAWTTRAYFKRLAQTFLEVVDILPGSKVEPDQAVAILRRNEKQPYAGSSSN